MIRPYALLMATLALLLSTSTLAEDTELTFASIAITTALAINDEVCTVNLAVADSFVAASPVKITGSLSFANEADGALDSEYTITVYDGANVKLLYTPPAAGIIDSTTTLTRGGDGSPPFPSTFGVAGNWKVCVKKTSGLGTADVGFADIHVYAVADPTNEPTTAVPTTANPTMTPTTAVPTASSPTHSPTARVVTCTEDASCLADAHTAEVTDNVAKYEAGRIPGRSYPSSTKGASHKAAGKSEESKKKKQ